MSNGRMLQEYLTAASRMAEFCISDRHTWDRFLDWMYEEYDGWGNLPNPDLNPGFYSKVPDFMGRLAVFAGSFPEPGE